jgi:hypothetical protein
VLPPVNNSPKVVPNEIKTSEKGFIEVSFGKTLVVLKVNVAPLWRNGLWELLVLVEPLTS